MQFIKNLDDNKIWNSCLFIFILFYMAMCVSSCTEYSLSTIINILSICGSFSNHVETSILEVTEEDCKKYFDKVNKISILEVGFSLISSILKFFKTHISLSKPVLDKQEEQEMINFVEAQIDNFFKNDVLDFRHFPEKEIVECIYKSLGGTFIFDMPVN